MIQTTEAKKKDEATGVMAMMGGAVKVCEGFTAVVNAVQSAQALYDLFTGADSGTELVVNAIKELTDVVEKGLKELEAAIVDQNIQQQWQTYRDQLHSWQQMIKKRANQLKSLDLSTMTVTAGAKELTIPEWCAGGGDDKGVLGDLATYLENLEPWFQDGPGAPGPLTIWDELSTANRASSVQGFQGETNYSLLLAWTEALYAQVQAATYVYNAALALYRLAPTPGVSYTDLDIYLAQLGNTSTPNTAWAQIEQSFVKHRALPILKDRGIVALASCDDPNGNLAIGATSDGSAQIWGGPVEGPASSFITGLQLAPLPGVQGGLVWVLQASFAQIDGTGAVGPVQRIGPSRAALRSGNARLHPLAGAGAVGVGVGYAPEISSQMPGLNGNNVAMVVTGAQISASNGLLVIALRYGWLCSNPGGNLSLVTGNTYYTPTSFVDSFLLPDDVQLVDLGHAGTASNLPITNASFMRIGNRMGILARHGWSGYQADQFQPLTLQNYTPPQLVPPRASPALVMTLDPL